MKRFTRALVVTMVAMFTLAAVTLATHSVSANFNPDPPVVGQNLTVTVTTDEPDYGNHLILEACRAFNMGDGETPTGAWSPASVCATIDGKWVELGKADADTVGGLVVTLQPSTGTFQTASIEPQQIVGFQYKHTPPGNHPEAQAQVDKTFVAPASGDPSPGCKGIENAFSKIKKGGQAEASLERVAEKLNCDLP
jgi:hypothetical protein